MIFLLYDEGESDPNRVTSFLFNAILYLLLILFGLFVGPKFGLGFAGICWLVFTFIVLVVFRIDTGSKGKLLNFQVKRRIPLVIAMIESN